ncbi:hypothetical protein H257_11270 [Aphanomyces astaci]|uniref:Uncharacterized protein n=1 Tax=Aphanomyces astaci TaxID=112090 RepID=W4G4T1_APHAT|nr:hypothetical protein H257_11270 [Aphanomyces astaci]ETV73953.1 hypothetical protein H257_11270 [Aphanomyces astaci]|eukprot:XP_009836466.1 hypothetical protein H257_11270 [Aphanomyces astaci]
MRELRDVMQLRVVLFQQGGPVIPPVELGECDTGALAERELVTAEGDYDTAMLVVVLTDASAYIGLSKGHLEGQNMLELNRVAGLVSVLTRRHGVDSFQYGLAGTDAIADSVYRSFRVTRLAVVHDNPGGERSYLDRPTLCYLITRRLLPQTRTDKKRSSLLLSSAAKYLFEQSHWIHHEIYYMDPASALFSGLVMLRWSESLYVMDINLWRLLTFERGCRRHATSTYLQLAIPHVE